MAWPSNQPGEPAVEPEAPAFDLARHDQLINAWLAAKAELNSAKEYEMNVRKELTDMLFPIKKKGTQRAPLNNGWNMKLAQTYTYPLGDKDKLDEDGQKIHVRDQVAELEDKLVKLGPLGEAWANRLIRWNPDLSGSDYEKLGKDGVELEIRNLIDELLTIKPGAPQLELEAPKED